MATLNDIIARFEALRGNELGFVVKALNEEKPHILDLNREQLYDGKNRLGHDLAPTYFDDPYFETREEAIGYSNWKDKITPNPRRTKGVPNLFINGYFYKSVTLKISLQGLHFNSDFDSQNDLNSKYGDKLFGLNKANKIDLNSTVEPSMINKIRTFVNL